MQQYWVLCPLCKSKTRLKVTKETVIKKLPLFCPKCKAETEVDIENGIVRAKRAVEN